MKQFQKFLLPRWKKHPSWLQLALAFRRRGSAFGLARIRRLPDGRRPDRLRCCFTGRKTGIPSFKGGVIAFFISLTSGVVSPALPAAFPLFQEKTVSQLQILARRPECT